MEGDAACAIADVEFDALLNGFGTFGGVGVTGVEGSDVCEGFIGPVLRRRAGGESDSGGGERHVVCDVLRGVEVFGEERWGHDECGSGVGETFSGGAVLGELACWFERGDAGEVSDGIGELAVGEAAE